MRIMLLIIILIFIPSCAMASPCGNEYSCKEETVSCGIEYGKRLNWADFFKIIELSKNKNYTIEYLNTTDSYVKFIYRENCINKLICVDQIGICEYVPGM